MIIFHGPGDFWQSERETSNQLINHSHASGFGYLLLFVMCMCLFVSVCVHLYGYLCEDLLVFYILSEDIFLTFLHP